jgi:hypothetical protein
MANGGGNLRVRLPSSSREGMKGSGKYLGSPSPRAPHRMHDCPESNMVQGRLSPLPTGRQASRGKGISLQGV